MQDNPGLAGLATGQQNTQSRGWGRKAGRFTQKQTTKAEQEQAGLEPGRQEGKEHWKDSGNE